MIKHLKWYFCIFSEQTCLITLIILRGSLKKILLVLKDSCSRDVMLLKSYLIQCIFKGKIYSILHNFFTKYIFCHSSSFAVLSNLCTPVSFYLLLNSKRNPFRVNCKLWAFDLQQCIVFLSLCSLYGGVVLIRCWERACGTECSLSISSERRPVAPSECREEHERGHSDARPEIQGDPAGPYARTHASGALQPALCWWDPHTFTVGSPKILHSKR